LGNHRLSGVTGRGLDNLIDPGRRERDGWGGFVGGLGLLERQRAEPLLPSELADGTIPDLIGVRIHWFTCVWSRRASHSRIMFRIFFHTLLRVACTTFLVFLC